MPVSPDSARSRHAGIRVNYPLDQTLIGAASGARGHWRRVIRQDEYRRGRCEAVREGTSTIYRTVYDGVPPIIRSACL